MFKKSIIAAACLLSFAALQGCNDAPSSDVKEEVKASPEPAPAAVAELKDREPTVDRGRLFHAIKVRTDEDKARDDARNPIQTLEFFRVGPGMAVAEALPGGGWYSKILTTYLGAEGELHGINYNDDMWPRFGFFSEEGIARAIERTSAFPNMITDFSDNGIEASGFTFNSAPEALAGTLDRVLFIRALHNLNRFEEEAGTLTEALKTTHTLLKDSGMVGVVQHQAPDKSSDKWADGSAGYLKKSAVIEAFKEAGFVLVSESDINANPSDLPTESEVVWRLPPSYNGTADDPALKAKVDAIGESNRMTLLFKKAP